MGQLSRIRRAFEDRIALVFFHRRAGMVEGCIAFMRSVSRAMVYRYTA